MDLQCGVHVIDAHHPGGLLVSEKLLISPSEQAFENTTHFQIVDLERMALTREKHGYML